MLAAVAGQGQDLDDVAIRAANLSRGEDRASSPSLSTRSLVTSFAGSGTLQPSCWRPSRCSIQGQQRQIGGYDNSLGQALRACGSRARLWQLTTRSIRISALIGLFSEEE